jgi:RES domain-containing protein
MRRRETPAGDIRGAWHGADAEEAGAMLTPGSQGRFADPPPPELRPGRGGHCAVAGTFYRAVAPAHAAAALSGSHRAGRYSRPGQPTLYLSASRAGVDAAMRAHTTATDPAKVVLTLRVEADALFDLRDAEAVERVRRAAGAPFGDWQQDLADGREPSSWRARDWIAAQGAQGLIDPSRQAPGLWHLVLFHWNVTGAPQVCR